MGHLIRILLIIIPKKKTGSIIGGNQPVHNMFSHKWTHMKRISTDSIHKIFRILPFLFLSACIVIPTPWTDDKISNEEISVITPGLSTKDDVLKKFNEPDVIWEIGNQEQVFVYKWERLRAVWLLAGGYNATGGPINTDEALLVQFDETDHVKMIKKGTKSGFESYGDFLNRCLKEDKE